MFLLSISRISLFSLLLLGALTSCRSEQVAFRFQPKPTPAVPISKADSTTAAAPIVPIRPAGHLPLPSTLTRSMRPAKRSTAAFVPTLLNASPTVLVKAKAKPLTFATRSHPKSLERAAGKNDGFFFGGTALSIAGLVVLLATSGTLATTAGILLLVAGLALAARGYTGSWKWE